MVMANLKRAAAFMLIASPLLVGACASQSDVDRAQATADQALQAAQAANQAAQAANQKADEAEARANRMYQQGLKK